jgi:hypothetical protein
MLNTSHLLDAQVLWSQSTQVLVLHGPKELRTEKNSNKVKARKVYSPRRERKRLLLS